MTPPKADGTNYKNALKGIAQQLKANQDEFFDVALLLYGNDAKSAMEKLKPMAAKNARALQIITYLRAGQVQMADEELMDATRELLEQQKLLNGRKP